MKLSKFNCVVTCLVLLCSLASFSQENINKKIEKLDKKFDFVSKMSDQQTFLTGKFVRESSNRVIGYENLKVVNLDGKVVLEKELANYKIQIPFGTNDDKYSNLFCLLGVNNKIGLINTRGEILLEPTYDHINGFNSKGQAIAFNGNDLQVLDSKGKKIAKDGYKYKVDYSSFFSIPTPGEINFFQVVNNNLVCSLDGEKYGVVNILTNKNVIPFEYSKIDPQMLTKESDTIGYKVYKDKLVTVRDIKINKELAPFIFEEIKGVFSFNDNIYLEGKNEIETAGTRETLTGYFDFKRQKFVFPKGLKMSKAVPIDGTFWIVENYGDFLIYNAVKNETIKTNDKIISIEKLTNKCVLYQSSSHASWIYDLEKNKIAVEFPAKPSVNSFSLKKEGKVKDFFTLSNFRGGSYYYTLYDSELNVVFSDLDYRASYIEEDRFIIAEDVKGTRVKTAYGFDGNIIGEKYKYSN